MLVILLAAVSKSGFEAGLDFLVSLEHIDGDVARLFVRVIGYEGHKKAFHLKP